MKLRCIKAFNEGIFIPAGAELEFSQALGDYLLSNYPASFARATDVSAFPSSSDAGQVTTPGLPGASEATALDAPPADKMVKRSKKK
jgi:hypothetical protein